MGGHTRPSGHSEHGVAAVTLDHLPMNLLICADD
jgi:hypothetical protein